MDARLAPATGARRGHRLGLGGRSGLNGHPVQPSKDDAPGHRVELR